MAQLDSTVQQYLHRHVQMPHGKDFCLKNIFNIERKLSIALIQGYIPEWDDLKSVLWSPLIDPMFQNFLWKRSGDNATNTVAK